MKQLHLGAQLYTVRQHMQTVEGFRETMRKIKDIGYKYVQVSGIGPDVTYKDIKAAVDETGLIVTLTHNNLTRVMTETEAVIEEHNEFGCDYIGVDGLNADYEHNAEGYKRFCEDMGPALEKMKAAGKTFLYHNHQREFHIHEGEKNGLDIILENSDPDALKLTIDTYWAIVAGADAAWALNKYASRIAVTHFKDLKFILGERTMTEMLEGIINYDPIIKACEDNDLVWNFIEQDKVYIDEFESMKISHDNMKKRYNMD